MGWLLVVASLYASAFGWFTPRKLREAWRGENALLGELDESLACDLVADFVGVNEYRRKVKCNGALDVTGDAARFGVRVDWEDRTYCLARTPGWQVLRHTNGVPCFSSPPPDPTQPIASENERVTATVTTQFASRLEGIRAAMQSDTRPPKCRKRKGATRNDVPLLEFELLQGDGGDEEWAFLSSSWLRDAVVKGDKGSLLTAAQRWGRGRPWVAVVTSATRSQAQAALGVGMARGTRARGRLTGTMTLVDAEAGELLCEAAFEFESSATLPPLPKPYGKRRFEIAPILDLPTSERVRSDFEARYHSAAMRTLNEMTGYDVWPTSY
jgi:hypothetical protein